MVEARKYSLGPDIHGEEHDTKELQELILGGLVEIDRVCRKNNIPYALGFGSALGLVNYQRFIPWDDDADVVINYFDIPRFIEAFKKDLSDKYTLEGYEIDKRYNVLIPTFKLRIKDSYQKETNWFWLPNKCKNGSGFFIDICAFMGVPEDKKKHKKLLKKAKRMMPWFTLVDAIFRINPGLMKKSLKKHEAKYAEMYKDSKMVSQSIIIPWQDMPKIVHENAFPKEIIYPFKECIFAGKTLYSFADPVAFVKLRYGEDCIIKKDENGQPIETYPENKRVLEHTKKYALHRVK